jgi:hypothetical protein
MHKIIILIIIISQFILGCSLKEDKTVIQQLDCPKHFLISEANSVLFENNSMISILNNSELNCYRMLDDPINVYIEITNSYQLSNAPDYELYEGQFNALLFITDREETLKIYSQSTEVSFNNDIKWNTKIKSPFLNKVDLQSFASVVLKFSDYSNGLRIFSAIN